MKNNDKFTKKKDELMSITVDLIAAEGLEGLSMRKVADKANIRMSTLYYYFKNKEQMIYDTFVYIHEDFLEHTKGQLCPDAKTDEEIFICYLRLNYDYMAANPNRTLAANHLFSPTADIDKELILKINMQSLEESPFFRFVMQLDLKSVKELGHHVFALCFMPLYELTISPFEEDLPLSERQLTYFFKGMWKSIQD